MDFKDGISRFISDAPPAHYIMKIQSFSLLTKNSIERYESGEFEAGGYKWKLVLYPSGNKSKNVKDHISLYLELHGADTFGKERRFNKMMAEWGFDQFIPLKDFNDDSRGYLVDDMCAFGAEVFVCRERSSGKGESFVMMKDATPYKHLWRIDNFPTKLGSECLVSKPFTTGKYNWVIKLYPNGKDSGVGNYFSLYLALAEPTTLPPSSKIYACIILRILDQKYGDHYYGKANYWVSASRHEIGYSRYVLISKMTAQNNVYMVNGTSFVEAEVTILGVVDELS
ncbi:TRAF-like [Sesbania bispinosa]|nr:TRAF-like [Sesbania bispinosa]